jgi:hypothetical protein
VTGEMKMNDVTGVNQGGPETWVRVNHRGHVVKLELLNLNRRQREKTWMPAQTATDHGNGGNRWQVCEPVKVTVCRAALEKGEVSEIGKMVESTHEVIEDVVVAKDAHDLEVPNEGRDGVGEVERKTIAGLNQEVRHFDGDVGVEEWKGK